MLTRFTSRMSVMYTGSFRRCPGTDHTGMLTAGFLAGISELFDERLIRTVRS